MNLLFSLVLIFASSAAFAKSHVQNALEDVRIALNDLRQAHHTQRMDLNLLTEDIDKLKNKRGPSNERMADLEKAQQKIMTDLRNLNGTTNQIAQSLSVLERKIQEQDKRLGEVVKLKATLSSISKAIGTGGGGNLYKVRSGDTLEKIARKHGTSIEAIKRANGLTSNTIISGQNLRIPK